MEYEFRLIKPSTLADGRLEDYKGLEDLLNQTADIKSRPNPNTFGDLLVISADTVEEAVRKMGDFVDKYKSFCVEKGFSEEDLLYRED